MGKKHRLNKKSRTSINLSRKRTARKHTRFVAVGIILLLFLLFNHLVFIFKGMITSFNPDADPKIVSMSTDNIESVLIVSLDKDKNAEFITLYVINSGISKLYIFNIPTNYYFYDYSKVLPVDYLSVPQLVYGGDTYFQDGIQYFAWDISESLGIPITSVIVYTPGEYHVETYNLDLKSAKLAYNTDYIDDSLYKSLGFVHTFSYINYLTHPNKISSITKNIKSNESYLYFLRTMARLNVYISNTDAITIVDLHNEWGKIDMYNDLGNLIEVLNTKNLDRYIQDNIEDLASIKILKERLTVEIYNGSEIPSLAFRYARKLSNSGITVLRYENAPTSFEKTTIYLTGEFSYKYTLMQIESSLQISHNDIEIKRERPSWITTADIVIVLGENVRESLW